MSNASDVEGRSRPGRVVITGTSSGIGRVLAQRLTARGWQVWGLARRVQEDVPGGRFRHSVCDVADWDSVKAAAAEVARAWHAVNALICCAGVQGAVGPAMELDPAAWTQTVHANLGGTFHSISAFHPLLMGSLPLRGKVLCFSGGGATGPRPNFSAYGVAKAGIVRLVETLAHEWGAAADINAIAPGALPTEMTRETIALGPARAGRKEHADAERITAQGPEAFEKVGALVEFMLSGQADGITGRLLSAPWDPWPGLGAHCDELATSDIFTLRRITPEDRGKAWS